MYNYLIITIIIIYFEKFTLYIHFYAYSYIYIYTSTILCQNPKGWKKEEGL